MKKKLLSLVLTIVFLLSAIPVSLTANAATISESESNDDYASANSFSLNSTVSGKMNSTSDKDFYRITPSQNGKISLTFLHNYSGDSDIYWIIQMFSYKSGTFTEFYNQKLFANSGEINELAFIGASSGGTYYIEISTYWKDTVNFSYSLKNEFTSSDDYEKEINNEYSSATEMSFNRTYGGVMNGTGDVDVYRFSPTQNGKIALTFTHAQSDDSDIYWNIEMFLYKSGSYTKFFSQKVFAKSGESDKLASIGASSGDKYYITVSTYWKDTVGFDYNISNDFTSTDYYEKEINNEYSSATEMSFNRTYGGVMNGTGDVDVYKFSPAQNGKISLTFSHEYSDDSNIYWDIKMYAYTSGSYTEFYNQRIHAKSAETNKLPPIGAASTSIYYIKISTYWKDTVGFDYNLKNEFTLTDNFEKEINNDYSTATQITEGISYGGVMNSGNDIDRFKVTLSNPSSPLTLSHDYTDTSDVYWDVKVIEAGTYSEKYSKRVRGSDNNGVNLTIEQSGTYYIQITTYWNSTTNFEYAILLGDPDTEKPEGVTVSGDVTGDDKTNVQDCTAILRYVRKLDTLSDDQLKIGDVTGDGKVNVQDVTRILRHVRKIEALY